MFDFELTKEKAKKKNLMNFTRQLSVFVKAGIPITDALTTIGDESTDVAIRRAITGMVDDLRNGGLLSAAAAQYPQVFPNYYIGILQAAELTGRLDESLDSLARLHRPRDRDPFEGGRRARLPVGRHGAGAVHGDDPRRLRAPAVQAAVRRARTPTCRCRRG